ncbi:hypothetical protein H181DRAFT_01072 [Streptomyces sp. WMMB 714]|uniref:hypothetical protein n=1 Tax=Streptomyces sp. WMMB 714 TaxID=1286822 RepID=UPI0005F7FBCC|nr:hypothetical protein [Streptomyces sp. WMMB 714]SCK15820.1 hypothetical protein H181DRAFT_01072 [Streptomyces sp. WMMB 714]
MHKNIRRSLMVAAAASGIWALGTTGANAAELPVPTDTVTGAVDEAGKGGGLTSTVDGAAGTLKKTTEGVTEGVVGKLPTNGIPENGLPSNTLPTAGVSEALGDTLGAVTEGRTDGVTGGLPNAGAASGAVGTAQGAAGKALDETGRASKAIKEVQKGVRPATAPLPAPAAHDLTDLAVAELPARTLPAVDLPGAPRVPALPSAPATGDLVNGLAAASVRPEPVTGALKGDHAQQALGTVRTVASAAQPVVSGSGVVSVLPEHVGSVIVHVQPAADQLASDVAVTVDDAAATSAPFAESTLGRTHCLVHEVDSAVLHFGHGVAADAVPYAHATAAGLHRNVDTTVADAASAVQIYVVPSTRDLTDAANIPGLPGVSQLPVNVPAVPAVPAV